MPIVVSGPVTPKRVAIYKRYSCDMQRPASLDDQERNCREYSEAQGWVVLDEYVREDAAKTGKTLRHRQALGTLLEDAQQEPPPFDVLMVDEGSRLTRKLKDALGIAEILKFNGVKLVIVSRKLDSDDPNFQTMLTLNGIVDEQNSEQMRHRVHRGMAGRVLAGFSPSGRCFGYRSEPVPDLEHPELQGRAAVKGYKWVPYVPEADTVRLIFRLFADGWSMSDIAKHLNAEAIAAPGKSALSPTGSCWRESAVKTILQNEKYIGVRIWNKTRQLINPVTEKTVTRKNAPEVWIRKEVPDLRIISDELWMRVRERLRIVNEKMTRHRIAGLNRAKRRDYLFSGLLECGKCGSPMNICSSGPSYVCSSWRYRGGCTNSLWIKEDRLTSQLIAALTRNLLVPEVMDHFVDSVAREYEQYIKGASHAGEDTVELLQKRQDELTQMAARIINALASPVSANSSLLPQRLADIEAEIAQVQTRRKLLHAPKCLEGAKLDVMSLARENIANLLEIVKQDAPKAREVLQRRISKLQLFPTDTPEGPAYMVYGEIDLFTPAAGSGKSVLLNCSSTRTVQQYTNSVDFVFRFIGEMLYTELDIEGHPLSTPFADLISTYPELLHEPKSAPEWTALLKSHLPPDAKLYQRLTSRYVKLHLRNSEQEFVRLFDMTTIAYRGRTWYMFSKGAPGHSPGEELVSAAQANTVPALALASP